ncbi:MAG TPA: TPM domain-containing protein [Steroidobacteraceae bacterium]|nr:TPM domain-containing protein [Steroidobacteraceae bacterium]
MSFNRALKHLVSTPLAVRRVFTPQVLKQIEAEVAASEARHGGEIRFAVEGNLSGPEVLRGVTPRMRSLHVFSHLRVWDTEQNNGVLIYVLWADRDVEIVADRGFNGRVSDQQWAEVCKKMEHHFVQGDVVNAVLTGIREAGALIAAHFPATDRNEQPDHPVIL